MPGVGADDDVLQRRHLAHRRMFWKVRAIPNQVIWWRFIRPMRWPSKSTVPEVGRYTPVMA